MKLDSSFTQPLQGSLWGLEQSRAQGAMKVGSNRYHAVLMLLSVKCDCAFLHLRETEALKPKAPTVCHESRLHLEWYLLCTIPGTVEKQATPVIFCALWFR